MPELWAESSKSDVLRIKSFYSRLFRKQLKISGVHFLSSSVLRVFTKLSLEGNADLRTSLQVFLSLLALIPHRRHLPHRSSTSYIIKRLCEDSRKSNLLHLLSRRIFGLARISMGAFTSELVLTKPCDFLHQYQGSCRERFSKVAY